MRKIRMLALLLGALLCLSSAAHALELPSNAVFSPGLKRLAALEKTQPNVEAQAQFSIEKAMYARDLSLLQAMLDAIVKRSISCHDWRYPARYIPGNTLKH